VLGPLEVVHDGVARRIGSGTQRTLLALLLMHPNEVASTDRVVDVLWPDDPEARRKLWFHVSKLRGILQHRGAVDDASAMLVTRPTGYALRIDLEQLDAARFERLARTAHSVLEDEPARASETLQQSLALWRGRPFEDVLHEDAVSSEVARLDELRLEAVEDRFDADLAQGRADALIPELETLVAAHPYREHLRVQLMLALYRAGRQAEALATYRRAQRTLDEELGIAPSEELKELQRRILGQDPALGGRHPAIPRAAAPRDERKIVTVFFADLVDFTTTAERLDPEDIRAFLMPYYARIRSELERFGGKAEKFIGDAVMAFFGAPVAHEDDPERAVRAGLAIRDWLAEQDGPRQARIAVATGEAHVRLGALETDGEPVAVGDVVNTAARLQAAAPVNGVVVGEQTFRATRHAIEYREAEPVVAKGRSTLIPVWEAIGVLAQPGVDPSRHHSPFVGRERELDVLRERLAWVVSERSPQLVTILGVPGIGKTRLVSELQQTAATDESVRWRQGRSLPYGDGVSLWALGEIVKAEAGILESDPNVKAERKLRNTVDRIVGDRREADRLAMYLVALLALGGEEVSTADPRGDTFAAWRQFIEALADERPLALMFEDLHWADDALLDFVDELVDRIGGVPLLVVVTARPELLERRSDWAGGKANALTLSLPPLSADDTRRLVAQLLEQQVVPVEAQDALLARVGGNPLYAEQFCRMLVEHGRLEKVPESLHGIIAARLDALADVAKRLLQDASVIGKVFWLGALDAMEGISRHDADELLQSLVRREFVQRARHSSVADDTEYAFRHELLRDVAYEEIPRARRAERHLRVAAWIQSLGRAEDHAELLAHHYLAALEYGVAAGDDVTHVVDGARRALQSAGLRAMRLSANERAIEYFSRAIDLLGRLPEGDDRTRAEAELQLHVGVALFALRGLGAPEVERAYTRATELMMASAPVAEQFPVDFGLSIFHGHRGNFGRSTRLVERLTEVASQGDDSMKLQALHARWMNSLFSGRIDDAVAAADGGLRIYRPEAHHTTSFSFGNHDPGVCALALQALALALRGESAKAVAQMHEAIALSERLGHAATLAQPLTQLPWALQINGDAEGTLLASQRALALEDEVAHPQFFGIAHAMRGWALTRMGHDEEGVAELERALADELRASHIWAAMIGAILAEVHLRHGRRDVARELLDQTHSLVEVVPTYVYEPEVMRVEAEWLRVDGLEDDARRLLLRAISIARKHGSWALALRSALALARSPSAERDRDLRLLADLYERLPPENDTDYGREARALLGRGVATLP
jgi:DNA-binding SARP family transcriptional activator